jgi:hypothetical protein
MPLCGERGRTVSRCRHRAPAALRGSVASQAGLFPRCSVQQVLLVVRCSALVPALSSQFSRSASAKKCFARVSVLSAEMTLLFLITLCAGLSVAHCFLLRSNDSTTRHDDRNGARPAPSHRAGARIPRARGAARVGGRRAEPR